MERRAIVVRGIVQGVGFRPFVHHLAVRLRLGGSVRNEAGAVLIEVEGETPSLERFLLELAQHPPPLAQIEHLSWESLPPNGERGFHIQSSVGGVADTVFISPDTAVCPACVTELFDPRDRRHGYPFLNCTNCGPRLTIIIGAPYDRPRTTMAGFPMCAACRAEYENPADRRFHAQPIACPVCGPHLQALNGAGVTLAVTDAVAWFAAELLGGKIGAMKGLGGYHLICDACDAHAVAELRRRKYRDEKPFAVMVRDLAAAEQLCQIDAAEAELMRSPACPIVLLRKRAATNIAEGVAPGNPYLGIMLPYTPSHHLLLTAVQGRPLVMTSGNRSDEPIAYQDEDAVARLSGIADCFLVHNRPIHVRCDDSVTRIVDGQERPVRRSRGYAPRPLELPFACPRPMVALGGQLKATFALGRGTQAFLSHHVGDLDEFRAFQAYRNDIDLYQGLFAVRPEVLVHDLHPDYASTRYAHERALGIRLLSVQHHHAHMASCMAEHRLSESVIGVTLDGTGLGTDGAVWGGEFLVGDYRGFRRAAHLRYVGMPGGDQAIREPWRMAMAHLRDSKLDFPPLAARISPPAVATVGRMLDKGINTPPTSSAGRLFDAVASLIGLRDRVSYEGQAAIELEWLASGVPAAGSYPFELTSGADGAESRVVDCRTLIDAVVCDVLAGIGSAVIARRFHTTMVEIITEVCRWTRDDTGCDTVVLSGGVFQNALLTRETTAHLRAAEFRVYRHRLVPPNDGGLSLGQLAVAAARLADSIV